jgi:hypothetical protein
MIDDEPVLLGGITIGGHRALQNAAYVVVVAAVNRMPPSCFQGWFDEIVPPVVINVLGVADALSP